MSLDSINTSVARAPEPLRTAVAPEPARVPVKAEAKPAPEKPNEEPAPRGVPRRIGQEQQLPPNPRLRVDRESNRIIAEIVDENNEVVRQIPPEALLELSSKFNQLEGLLFDRET